MLQGLYFFISLCSLGMVMNKNKIENVVIVGGGTAGWITAAMLAKILGNSINITLVESDEIGTIGVGEATIPPIVHFNNAIGLDEQTFLKETKATFKLGIEFENWGKQGDKYMHAFGGIGKNFPFCDFHNFWLKSKQAGNTTPFGDYSVNYQAAKQNKFDKLQNLPGTNLQGLVYAYHFDAGLYAKLLRKHSEAMGVTRIEGKIEKVNLHQETGYVKSVQLENSAEITGDLFVDCSGLSALLIEKALSTGFEDWSHWLPCDRAIAVPCESTESIAPYTCSIAHESGWQWRIPLQHRIGNGLVYASKYMSDEEAKTTLLNNLDGKPLGEPRIIPFKTGIRRKQWHRNVVAIGLSSGFFEPLESTNIHLIQSAATRLVKFFPHNGIKAEEVSTFNRQARVEAEKMRDFIILHYKLNQKENSPFWQACQRMEVPKSLSDKIALFVSSGKVFRDQEELFAETAWQQVMIGQGAIPNDYHPLVNSLSATQLSELMSSLTALIDQTVDKLPTHSEFLSTL